MNDKRKPDPELAALSRMMRILVKMDEETRNRVLRYLLRRFLTETSER